MAAKLTLEDQLIRVLPEIDTSQWTPQCPVCKNEVEIDKASYFTFSHRHWCEGKCTSCEKELILDVPALLYNFRFPQILDVSTRKVYGEESWWKKEFPALYFNYYKGEPFKKSAFENRGKLQNFVYNIKEGNYGYLKNRILQRQVISTSDIHYESSVKPEIEIVKKNGNESAGVIFFNAIDEYYGHCTRYLQFIYNFYEEHAEKIAVKKLKSVVLVPEYLKFYVPDFMDEVWIAKHLPAPFGRKTFTHREFSDQVNQKLHQFDEVYLVAKQTNIYKGVDAGVYFKTEKASAISDLQIDQRYPKFLFYNREDWRAWGGTSQNEIKNFEALANLIKENYPQGVIYLMGMDPSVPIKGDNIADLRKPIDPENLEKNQCNLIKLLTHIDCALGVHGSHMTEISALCKSVITLQPDYKYANYTDDMFLIRSENFIPELSRFYPVFGDEFLKDISVEKVFALIQASFKVEHNFGFITNWQKKSS